MRRTIAILTGATAAALVVPVLVAAGPASARSAGNARGTQNTQNTQDARGTAGAATDPVSALKRHFRPHRGVRISENTKIIGRGGKQRTILTRRDGVLEFGTFGPVASDLTTKFTMPTENGELKGLFAPSRTISLKGVTYTSGGAYADAMPEGKKWLRTRGESVTLVGPVQQIISIVEPATLKATLARTAAKRPGGTWDDTRTTVHSGTITLAELYRASPAIRTMLGRKPTGPSATLPVTWKIYLGSDRLVRRVVSSYTESTRGLNSTELTYVNDTRYTGWGMRSALTAPPADQVADFDELNIGADQAAQAQNPVRELFEN
ncbi:hypothetical protein FHS43_000806 [Streptosporangium becharense]|uniref:Lipoprotein n=1 Tax=Streptosporangium becharense TaxID=1816182 RepID=A0A7W9IEX5_9ACTN|nr:hypothetical protein [Streptosporangium becharense]MBB2909560.1 hypothetical protein [Streptosporangium becharense]MBB5819484.1 hypothetical protein [Streptosporangium becharense]